MSRRITCAGLIRILLWHRHKLVYLVASSLRLPGKGCNFIFCMKLQCPWDAGSSLNIDELIHFKWKNAWVDAVAKQSWRCRPDAPLNVLLHKECYFEFSFLSSKVSSCWSCPTVRFCALKSLKLHLHGWWWRGYRHNMTFSEWLWLHLRRLSLNLPARYQGGRYYHWWLTIDSCKQFSCWRCCQPDLGG